MLDIAIMKKALTPFKESNIAFIKRRLKEMGIPIVQAERLAKVPKDTIQKMLLGYGTDYENYVAVIKALQYSVPLYGKLISGVGVEMVNASLKETPYVKLHEGIEYSPDLNAIVVADDRYEPRYFRGTILYFRETKDIFPKVLDSKHPHVVKVIGSNADVVIVRPGGKVGSYNLLAIDGSAHITTDVELEWCAPIEGAKWEY